MLSCLVREYKGLPWMGFVQLGSFTGIFMVVHCVRFEGVHSKKGSIHCKVCHE